MPKYVAAIDQGTTSTRCMLFDHAGQVISIAQKEHEQIFPRPGWVEHNPIEIWERTRTVIQDALILAGADTAHGDVARGDIAAVGITNQRETTLVWDRKTGRAYYNAIVWQDTRTDQIINALASEGGQDRFRAKVGCRWRHISPARRSSGSWTTWTACARRPSAATRFSATSIAG
jgi:glycerol kinase